MFSICHMLCRSLNAWSPSLVYSRLNAFTTVTYTLHRLVQCVRPKYLVARRHMSFRTYVYDNWFYLYPLPFLFVVFKVSTGIDKLDINLVLVACVVDCVGQFVFLQNSHWCHPLHTAPTNICAPARERISVLSLHMWPCHCLALPKARDPHTRRYVPGRVQAILRWEQCRGSHSTKIRLKHIPTAYGPVYSSAHHTYMVTTHLQSPLPVQNLCMLATPGTWDINPCFQCTLLLKNHT